MFENEGQGEIQPVESEVTETTTPEQTTQAAPSIPDLDSMEKFKYGGREMTAKELRSEMMMQSDYTKKTQAMAEERKYHDNLRADLAAVKANPSLAEKFKSIYPERFHAYLEYVTPSQQARAEAQPTQQRYAEIDPNVMQRFQRMEADMTQREVAAINAQLDAKFSKLSEKFPFADEEAAIARAQTLQERGEKLTDQVWENIWKSVHDKNEGRFKQIQSAQAQKQKTANAKGKDAAQGGGIPGQAPVKPKTIKEASKFALEAMDHL